MVLARLRGALSSFPRFAAGFESGNGIFKLYTTMKISAMKSAASAPLKRSTQGCQLPELYRRISPIGDPAVSIVPVLDQWIREGKTVNYVGLILIVKKLRSFRRYKQALEVSLWMTEKRYYTPSPRDSAIRLDLIAKVDGINEAEAYFDVIPKNLRTGDIYSSLLNCYAHVKNVEKAESIMQEMADLGLERTRLSYNILLNLYYKTQNYDKLENLVHKMQEEGIGFDQFTYGILISTYAATSNIKEMDKLLTQLESDPKVNRDSGVYAVAAIGYRKVGLPDRAFSLLKKSEELTSVKRRKPIDFLISEYATMGKKEEVMRLWEIYRKGGYIYNLVYKAMIKSLLKFDDLESAKKIFEEWESRKVSFDIRIPNCMIRTYCRKGLLEAGESLVNRLILNGEKLDSWTWYDLAQGYLQCSNSLKGVEYMKEAIAVSKPGWIPSNVKYPLATCLDYLKGKGDLEEAKEFIRSLRNKDIISVSVHDRLMNWITDMESSVPAIDGFEGDSNQETSTLPEHEEDASNVDFFLQDRNLES